MGKLERRQEAQDMLMNAATHAFYANNDRPESADERAAMELALRAQLSRIEKLFGYEVGSWKV